jgi:ribosomal protein S18 acetylase RimI-like enzyme
MVAYVGTAHGIEHGQLTGGFFADWPVRPSSERHLELLRGSYAVELAMDDGKVIGFATATSDGVLSAYIPLLEVLPEYRGRGIGSELMRRLLLRLDGLYMVDLSCDSGVEAFYERFGFRVLDRAMGLRRRERLRRRG